MSVWRAITRSILHLFVIQTNSYAQLQITTTFQSQYQTLLATPHLPRLTLTSPLPSKSTYKRHFLDTTKLATPHNRSPFAGGSIWDPSDEEWAEVDAYRIANTFIASFKNPGQKNGVSSPQKDRSALSRLTSTITSLIPLSPTKNTAQETPEEEPNLREKLSMLQNTYYTSPSGDLSDSIMRTCFLLRSRIFTSTSSSPRTMHVIDLFAYFTTKDPLLQTAHPRLCDATATILSHTNIACITAFLNPSVQEFTYKREVEGRKGGTTLLIRRHRNSIIVRLLPPPIHQSTHLLSYPSFSFAPPPLSLYLSQAGSYRNLGFSLQWSLYVRSRFNALGQWYDEYAAPTCGTTPVVGGEVMWDVFTPDGVISGDGQRGSRCAEKADCGADATSQGAVGFRLKEGDGDGDGEDHGGKDAKLALYQSRMLARYLVWDVWVRLEGRYECRATWEADGEVNTVRLKRGLVGFDGDDDEDEEVSRQSEYCMSREADKRYV
ncbi:hypothetical protein GGP41_009962 [Bipolaris sorokiniana]|uniref:Uncharacterized protein n=1 Tax=Cochliobolus sativus TaxID=45130 RepID=A0A8H6DUW7_COCSA|nr:hypothetical protein GGP41_009962 [Bipolaris sorokiniana]